LTLHLLAYVYFTVIVFFTDIAPTFVVIVHFPFAIAVMLPAASTYTTLGFEDLNVTFTPVAFAGLGLMANRYIWPTFIFVGAFTVAFESFTAFLATLTVTFNCRPFSAVPVMVADPLFTPLETLTTPV